MRYWLSLLALVIGVGGFTVTYLSMSRASAVTNTGDESSFGETVTAAETQEETRDFSVFSHSKSQHSRLPCLLCHKREDNSPRPKLPGHLPCSGCHKQEFANNSSPICTICHTNTQSGALKAFPTLKSFTVRFDHARHTGAGRTSASCATCHKAQRGGVAFTIPARVTAHSTCFACHSPGAKAKDGSDISSCSTCHNLGRLTRTSDSSIAYRRGFSHALHDRRKSLNCSDCHSVRAGAAQSRQVSSPVPAMHSASARAMSCMACHNDKRAFGTENFQNCRRCHQGPSFRMAGLGSAPGGIFIEFGALRSV